MGFFNPCASHVPITHQYRSNSLLTPGGAVNTVEDWNIAVVRAELQPCFIMIKVHGNEGSSEWLWGPLSCFCIFSFIVLFLCLCSLSFVHDNLLFMSSVLFPLSESFPPQFFGAIRCPSSEILQTPSQEKVQRRPELTVLTKMANFLLFNSRTVMTFTDLGGTDQSSKIKNIIFN